MKTILLFFLLGLMNSAQAQLQAYISYRQNFEKNNNELLHDLCVKTYPNRAFRMQFDYYIQNKKTDSFTVFSTSDEAKFYNNYWHYTIAHQLPIANYSCSISIVELASAQKWNTEETIEMITLDSLGLSPIYLQIKDTSVTFNPICFENFCDTFVNILIAKTILANTEKVNNDIVFYTRVSKKNKPNSIYYSKQDTIAKSIIQKNKTYLYSSFIPLQKLTSGNYIANIAAIQNNIIISKQQFNFQCIQPKQPQNSILQSATEEPLAIKNITDFKNTFVAKYDINKMRRNLTSLQAIVPPNQYKVIEQLANSNDDTLMKQYFYNFWQMKNNENPEKYWKDYTMQLNDCVKNYGGINTDQSFAYLRYGKPDKVETVLNEPNTIPYEIWQYENIGALTNVVFLFIQKNGVNNQMNLLHSTHPLEKQFLAWQQFLIKGEPQNNRILEYLQVNGKSR
jgi:GWxTD domain-containing protein